MLFFVYWFSVCRDAKFCVSTWWVWFVRREGPLPGPLQRRGRCCVFARKPCRKRWALLGTKRPTGIKPMGLSSRYFLVGVFAHKLYTHHFQMLYAHITVFEFVKSVIHVVVMAVAEVVEYIFLLVFIEFLLQAVIKV